MSPVVDLYRRWLSPLLHSVSGVSGACRFQPTCSEYAVVAVSCHGMLYGATLALWRVLRCQPFGRGGFDPVPGTYPVAPLPHASLPEFPVEFRGFPELDAPFFKERRTRSPVQSCVQETRGSRTDDPRHLP